jgi:hypothetical protein
MRAAACPGLGERETFVLVGDEGQVAGRAFEQRPQRGGALAKQRSGAPTITWSRSS